MWYIYTMQYYSAIKRNAFESVQMRWMTIEPIIQWGRVTSVVDGCGGAKWPTKHIVQFTSMMRLWLFLCLEFSSPRGCDLVLSRVQHWCVENSPHSFMSTRFHSEAHHTLDCVCFFFTITIYIYICNCICMYLLVYVYVILYCITHT